MYGDGSKPYQRPDGRWVARVEAGWTPAGTRRRRAVVGATEAECKRRLRDLRRAMLAETTTHLDPRTTVKKWAEEWLADTRTRVRPTTWATDRGVIAHHIIPTIGNRRLCDLGAGDAHALDRAVLASGASTTTARYARLVAQRMLKAAKAAGYTVPDPVLLAPKPQVAAPTRSALPAPDAARLLAAAFSRHQWPPLPPVPVKAKREKLTRAEAARRARLRAEADDHRLALEVDPSRWVAALLQGLRSGEARGLRWEDVDLAAGVLRVSWQLQELPLDAQLPQGFEARHLGGSFWLTRPKTRAGIRQIPLIPAMVDALTVWRQVAPVSAHNLVWPRPDGSPMSKAGALGGWRGLQRAAGVSKPDGSLYVLHEARHTTVSLLAAADVPPSVIIAIVGHATWASSAPYSHVDLVAAREALSLVADRLDLTAG